MNKSVIASAAEYHSPRQQSVVRHSSSSRDVLVTSPIPQGSVLGPLLCYI